MLPRDSSRQPDRGRDPTVELAQAVAREDAREWPFTLNRLFGLQRGHGVAVLTRRVRVPDPARCAEAVVVEVAEAVGEPSGFLDEHVYRLGAAVAEPVGVEVDEHL